MGVRQYSGQIRTKLTSAFTWGFAPGGNARSCMPNSGRRATHGYVPIGIFTYCSCGILGKRINMGDCRHLMRS
jgi:hypothetical protein